MNRASTWTGFAGSTGEGSSVKGRMALPEVVLTAVMRTTRDGLSRISSSEPSEHIRRCSSSGEYSANMRSTRRPEPSGSVWDLQFGSRLLAGSSASRSMGKALKLELRSLGSVAAAMCLSLWDNASERLRSMVLKYLRPRKRPLETLNRNSLLVEASSALMQIRVLRGEKRSSGRKRGEKPSLQSSGWLLLLLHSFFPVSVEYSSRESTDQIARYKALGESET